MSVHNGSVPGKTPSVATAATTGQATADQSDAEQPDADQALAVQAEAGLADAERADAGQANTGQAKARPRAAVSSGNPRINVAFPFAKIDIREPSQELRELAGLVEELAEQVVLLTKQTAPDRADDADQLAAQAVALARRVGGA